MNPLFPKSESA